MDAKTKEEIELLQELIDSPDTPQDEKELYRDTIKELKAEAEKAEKSKPEPKVEKKPETKKEEPKAKAEKKPATPKPSATKKEAPKKLPVDADKMKAEIKDRTGKTEEECEEIIAEYRKLREKSKKIEAKRLGKLDDEGKLIDGTREKTAAAVIETAAENIKDKLEKQVDKMEKDAEKGNPTPDQIEARINKNLGQLSKEMTKQATGFIKGIQAELGKADKTEAKQFLMNVRAEIDELLSKFAGGGGVPSSIPNIGDGVSTGFSEYHRFSDKLEAKKYATNLKKRYSDWDVIVTEYDGMNYIMVRVPAYYGKRIYSGGGGIPNDSSIIIGDVDITYDDNMEEMFGIETNDISGKKIKTKDLISFLSENLKTSSNIEDYVVIEDAIHTSHFLNEKGEFASKEDLENWRKGKSNVYNAYYIIYVDTPSTQEEISRVTGIKESQEEFAGGGWLRDRRQVNQSEDYETRYEKKNNTGRTSYAKKKNSVASIFGGGGEIKWVVFNKEEDEAYESALEYYLNEGYSDLKAERLAISDLKKEFPRLKKELVGNYKISLGTSITSEFAGGGGVNSLLEERRAFLQELIDNGIIDEEHYYFEETTDAINSNDDEQMRVLIDEMVSSDVIDKSFPDYKRALRLSKKQFGVGGGVDGQETIDLGNNFKIEIENRDLSIVGETKKRFGHYVLITYNGKYFKDFLPYHGVSKQEYLKKAFDYLSSLKIISSVPSRKKVHEDHPRKGECLVFWKDYFDTENKKVFKGDNSKEDAEQFVADIEAISSTNFKTKQFGIGGGVDAGFVQTYNITQGNMSSSSVNPSQFGEGGDIPPFEGERFSQEEFDYRLNLAKSQIISDIMDGTVDPTKINDFGDLGAFVDHNYYGGFIEDDYDHSEGFVFEMKVQDALANWIEEGGINKALENPEMFAVGGSVEDQISYADARINNLKELRSVSNEDMRENIDFQIEAIENQKAKLLSGELVPRKKLFGLF